MYLFESLNLLIQRYLPEEQIKRLKQAYLVARDAHEGQTRSSGEPYITHPVAVACILAEMRLDHETLMAALLHDVIEDTPATYQDMEQLFGKSVAELVEGVSKLDKLKFQDKKEAQAENFRKMIMAMVQDIRVVLIKLADRTHNMRTPVRCAPTNAGASRVKPWKSTAPRPPSGYSSPENRAGRAGLRGAVPEPLSRDQGSGESARQPQRDDSKILSEIEGRLTEAGIACRVSGRENTSTPSTSRCTSKNSVSIPSWISTRSG